MVIIAPVLKNLVLLVMEFEFIELFVRLQSKVCYIITRILVGVD
jgi:hypothetical protein